VTERVLTARELNRPLLARQLLLERARLPVTRALERVGPLHAQGVESTYVNLWSRVEGFRREQLTRALDEKGRLLLDLPRAPLPPAETPAPPRFLLRWDNLYMAHRSGERDRIVPDRFSRQVYTVNAVMPTTFLVDGFVAGSWRYERGRVELEPWRRLTRAERAELDCESARLADFMGG
jgi:hypothetical protein